MGTPVVTNLLVGPAWLYFAPVGESEPDETTIGVGTAWGGNWERMGYTKEGAAALYEFETAEADVQELLTAAKRWKTAEKMSVETVLAELIADNLVLAVGAGTVSTTSAGASQVAFEELQVGGVRLIDEYAVGLEGTYTDASGNNHPVRIFIHRAQILINGPHEFAKDGQPGIPVKVDALADTSKSAGNQLFKFQRVTAPTT